MARSKHQLAVAALRHRRREAYERAAAVCMDYFRRGVDDREQVLVCCRAVAELDAIDRDLALVEAERPKPLRHEEDDHD